MPRKYLSTKNTFPYFVSARCIDETWFSIPPNDIWTVMEDYLYFISHAYKLEIYAFVLARKRFYLLVKAPEKNLSPALNYFMRETSRTIGKMAGRINQIYGARFHRCSITSDHHFRHTYKFIYRIPVNFYLNHLTRHSHG